MSRTNKEHFDVIIVGAGLSGIGAAVELLKSCPGRSFAILEGRPRAGGTWDLFRYPGIRCDSDMYTFGYSFKPWRKPSSILDGESILSYLLDTAEEYELESHIRFEHSLKSASWSSGEGRWNLNVNVGDESERVQLSCGVLYMCSGYYSYRGGYTPDFLGSDSFQGTIVHPQQWPEDLNYTNKKVVVIGSGATAITLVPSLAKEASHVIMLQRSPTYIVSRPSDDRFIQALYDGLPRAVADRMIRWLKNYGHQWSYKALRRGPKLAKALLVRLAKKELGPDFDIEKDFTPDYAPWDQRICVAPDGDFFKVLKSGAASVVTDCISRFTPRGIELESGDVLEADIVVTATGLNLVILGEVDFSVDGSPIDFSETWSYKGVAFSGVPNLFSCFGYVNASWTLRAELVSAFVGRVVNHLHQTQSARVIPTLRPSDRDMIPGRGVEGFSPGYISRSAHLFPKQGDRKPWINPQDYRRDERLLLKDSLDDGVLAFSS